MPPNKKIRVSSSDFFAKNFTAKITQDDIQSFLLSFDCFPSFYEPEITVWFLCIRLRQSSIERVMDLTDSFTWEDLPTRDADTGHLTAAGWIPLTMKYSRSVAIVNICFHTIQSTLRIVTNHETVLIAWYPFDWTVSPFYELVNISQVTISNAETCSNCSYSILNLTDLVVLLLFSFYFPSYFLSYFFIYFPLSRLTTERW